MTRLRLLFISHNPYYRGGACRSLLSLIKYLRNYYDIRVELDRRPGDLPNMLLDANIPCLRLSTRTVQYLPSLVYQIKKQKIDVVYGNNFSGRCAVALWAARLVGRPYIWHIRESITKKAKHSKFLRFADAIIANSNDTANRVKELAPHQKVFTITNGVELENFNGDRETARNILRNELHLPHDMNLILNVGSICKRKNQIDTIEAFHQVTKVDPSIALVLVGDLQDSDYISQIYQRSIDLGIQDRVHIVGSKSDVSTYMLGADILMHTANKEPQGRVILEAMAARLPVVAYQVGGIPESVINGVTGLLVPQGDIGQLAKAAEMLLSDPSVRHRMGDEGYLRVAQHFTAEETANKVRAVIEAQYKRMHRPGI